MLWISNKINTCIKERYQISQVMHICLLLVIVSRSDRCWEWVAKQMLLGHATIYQLEKITSLSVSNSCYTALQFSLWGLSCLVELSVQIILEGTSQSEQAVIKKNFFYCWFIAPQRQRSHLTNSNFLAGYRHTFQLSLIWRGCPSILFLDRCVDLAYVS